MAAALQAEYNDGRIVVLDNEPGNELVRPEHSMSIYDRLVRVMHSKLSILLLILTVILVIRIAIPIFRELTKSGNHISADTIAGATSKYGVVGSGR